MTRRLLVLLALLAAVLWGAWIRIDATLSDPNFDREHAAGLLRSDPALLYYIVEDIARGLPSGELTPPDFRADPRVQHPDLTDLPAEFAVAQEFLVAWAYCLEGPSHPVPLHVVALLVMSLVAALFVVGVFLAVRAVTASDLWALSALGLALVTPANYRTIGFLLVKEDLALPLFLIHLGWLACALRSRRRRDFAGSGLVLAAALASWHAMGFVLLLELGVVWLGFLWSARSPFETPDALWILAGPLLAGLLVPALRLAGFLYSPAVALALGLWACAFARRLHPLRPLQRRLVALGAAGVWFGATRPLAPDAYGHVYQVLFAKLRYLGQFPADPNALGFDARLLWQGPFETLAPADLAAWLGWPLAALAALALAWHVRARGAGAFERLLLGLALVSLPVAWLFGRLAVLPGFFLPILCCLALARWRSRPAALAAFGLAAVAQLAGFASFVHEHRIDWYLPREARAELARMLAWVDANVPADEAIAADFVNSPAILAHTRRAIVLQPKYETEASRRKAEAFLTTLYQGTSADFAKLLRERFACRYLLVDRYVLWDLSRTTAGLPADASAPRADTAAAALLSTDEAALRAIPGFELLYRSEPPSRWADYRLYRLQ